MDTTAMSDGFMFPASFAQQRLWFLDQLEPDSTRYNILRGFRVFGALNLDALQKTIATIVDRHEALRTTFTVVGGQPMQYIAETASIAPRVIDLSGYVQTECDAEVKRLIHEALCCPFDLARGPLLDVTLIHLRGSEHILLLAQHHIISDAWSMDILVREMAALYAVFLQGVAPSLPELPVQYADFAEWQRDWLDGEVLASQVRYWTEQLRDAKPLVLPADHRRPAAQSQQGSRVTRTYSKATYEGLKALSQCEGATLFMTLLAAFQVLLHRYSGEDDIVVGSPASNRNQLELEGVIGFFVNTLVLRTNVSGNPTFREVLARVQEVTLGAYAHPDLPFDKLVEELQLPRDLSYHPLFQVMFVFQRAFEPLQLPGLSLKPLEVDTQTAKFDVTFELEEGPGGLSCAIEYRSELFERGTMERMAEHFATLLAGIVGNPDAHLSELPMLTAAERHQLLVERNATHSEYPRNSCIHTLFEEQAERTPESAALLCEGQPLTYRELNGRANQLAAYLRKLDVGSELCVGVCLQRSLDLVVALLGTLKAGGAYVPLDPEYPKQRLAFMLEDSGVGVLLTERKLVSAVPCAQLAHLLLVDGQWEQVARESMQNVPAAAAADQLAYVMYTSGSTGTPKGVEVRHRGVVRLVRNTNYARLGAGEVFLQLAPTSFDAATFELWGALLNGATCAVYPPEVIEPRRLGAIITQYKVSTLWLTVSLFNAIVDDDPRSLKGLSQLLIGGDQLSLDHVRRAQEALPDTQIINGYGPTENTTFTCCYTIPPVLERELTSLPIGRPIANTTVYVLDKYLQPVPVGVPGELYTGGDGLARGYCDRPEMTAERFISNPFCPENKSRLYRTGDLVRWRADGNLEFLGRIDHQVKVRGFRIELGEIEAALAGHDAVRNVVVEAREDVPGDKRLVAYIIADDEKNYSVNSLREYVKDCLPDYMLPNIFVRVDALPLSPNGKVNRNALPLPEHARPELDESYLVPRTDIEQVLADIWAEVLDVERVGVNDNFFELGGHSLLAVRLFVSVRDRCGIDLPLATLFRAQTIAALAELIDTPCVAANSNAPSVKPAEQDGQWQSLVPMQTDGMRPPIFFIHAIGGNVLNYFPLLSYLGSEQPVYGLQARGLDGVLPPFSSIEKMARYYIKEIRSVQPDGPYYLSGASSGGTVAFEIAQQLVRQGQRVALLALLDTIGPGERGYRHMRMSLIRRLTPVGGLDVAQRRLYPLYFANKIGNYLGNRRRTVKCEFYRMVKRTIPLELRAWNLLRHHNVGLINYIPEPYSGSVILFRAPQSNSWPYDDPKLGWQGVANGSLKIIDIPAEHLAFTESPELGMRLAEELRSAQRSTV